MKKLMVIFVIVLVSCVALISGCTENTADHTTIKDTDGDGYNDTVDAFPADNTEWLDTDADSVGDNSDAFPYDANETRDTDGDGIGDNSDAFPTDPAESRDTDGDGVGDNTDFYPNDPTRWEPPSDVFLRTAQPFLNKLVLDDNEIRGYAYSIITGCDASSTDCFVNALYRDILLNYTCLSSPMNSSTLQTPQQTMQRKQGTCEDLSLLLCSVLSNIGITSYLVFTDAHVYAMVADITADHLWNISEQSLRVTVEKAFGEPLSQQVQQIHTLDSREIYYIGGTANQTYCFPGIIEYMTIDYSIQSDQSIDVFIVSSETDIGYLQSGDLEQFFPLDERIQITTATGTSPHLDTYGGIILFNNNLTQTPTVNMDLLFTFQPSFYSTYNRNKMTVYPLWGKNSVILDPTLDDFGFPGYDAEVAGVKIAIDPLTNQYITLS